MMDPYTNNPDLIALAERLREIDDAIYAGEQITDETAEEIEALSGEATDIAAEMRTNLEAAEDIEGLADSLWERVLERERAGAAG